MRLTRKHIAIGFAMAIPLAIVMLDIFLRLAFGFGNPLLYKAHPTIEYLLVPNQTVKRLGNLIETNQYSMRSENFGMEKPENELRLLIIGDSVVNGGSYIDQTELASSIVKNQLEKEFNFPVTVGNISAGSWGPPNMLAYINEFGFFQADMIFVVLSSHDYYDVPTFENLDPRYFPQTKPFSAISEVMFRYLPRYFPFLDLIFSAEDSNVAKKEMQFYEQVNWSMKSLKTLLSLAQQNNRRVFLIQHLEKEELLFSKNSQGHNHFKEICDEIGVEVVRLASSFAESLDQGENPYRDHIHPNVVGQRLIANKVIELVKRQNGSYLHIN